jgi:outer membrane receptor protein involved in Fe transport
MPRTLPPPTRPRVARASAAACALVCGVALGGEAPPPNADLPTVTVIGVTPYGGAEQSLAELAGAAQSADAEDLARSHADDVSAFMNRRLGSVYINENQGNPLQPDLNYRGFTASPLLGTAQGMSVYLDGMRLNQPFGDVVSWDLIPRAAIQRMELVSGSSPLFGVNSLGGALSLHTKDGYSAPGTSLAVSDGTHDRRQVELETGGHTDSGLNWYVTANRYRDAGWRALSPSDSKQAFGKLGWRNAGTEVALSAAIAQSDLNGNGLQDHRLLARDYTSVYTSPDATQNRSGLLSLRASHELPVGLRVSGNAWYRNLRTATQNGDVNEAALGQDAGAPTTADCIASVQQNQGQDLACAGLVNRTALSQHNAGLAVQLQAEGVLLGLAHRLTAGFVHDESRSHFRQNAQYATLTASRAVVGVDGPGAFADGTQTVEDPFNARVDLGGSTRMQSLYAVDSVSLTRALRLNLAARYDRQHSVNRDALSPGGGPGSLDGDYRYSRLNPALGLLFTASDALSVYASYSEASRAPSSIELGCADPLNPCKLPNAMTGDPPLTQVVTTTQELGARGKAGGSLDWTAALFRADNRDDILFVADNQAGFGYFRNVGRTRRQGLELGLDGRAARLTYGLHATLLDATYRGPERFLASANSSNDAVAPGFQGAILARAGDRIPLIPRHLVKAYLDWEVSETISLTADGRLIGPSPARGNENNLHAPDGLHYLGRGDSGGFATVDLGAEWRPVRRVRIWLEVSNALNRRYATAAQLGTTAFDATGRFVARPYAGPVIEGERPLQHTSFLAPGAPRSIVIGVRYQLARS